VLVLEAQGDVGGAVRSDRELDPDFVQDTCSAFYPLTAASPFIRAMRLEEHGLTWTHAPAVLGHPRVDGSWALLHRNRDLTAALMDQQHAGDGDAWLELCAEWDRIEDQMVGVLLTPFPPVKAGLGLLRRLPSVGGLGFVKTLVMPAMGLGQERFGGEGPRLLIAGNAGHADIPLNAPGSGLMGLLMTMLGQTVGFPVPQGGAGQLTQALARRARSLGGVVRCSAEVAHIDVEGGRATGVRTADGERYAAANGVLADVNALNLYGGLVAEQDVPDRVRRGMRRFDLDPSTIKVDWALDGPVPWQSAPPHAPGTVHVADSLSQMTEATSQVASGVVPDKPFLLMGQMTTTDPTRSPAGTESAWAYTHVPQHVVSDAGEDGLSGRWDHDELERFADRVQARVEALAPGFSSRVRVRRVLGPHELEAIDANLVGGAINGGTSQLHQELVLRPVPGLGRAETAIGNLYLASASAHPGGGVHGAPGMNAARAAVAHRRLHRVTGR
jgi:phytoene dehydrogenase-like protein